VYIRHPIIQLNNKYYFVMHINSASVRGCVLLVRVNVSAVVLLLLLFDHLCVCCCTAAAAGGGVTVCGR
jgi:hypothetical protein